MTQNIQAAALTKAIRLALRVEDDGKVVQAGIDGAQCAYGGLESFHVTSIHDFCRKLIATGFVSVDESVLKT